MVPHEKPTLALALRLLDQELRPVIGGAGERWESRTFEGAEFWSPGVAPSAYRGRILLVPGALSPEVISSLLDALSAGAVAILLTEGAAENLSRSPELAALALALAEGSDWSDTATILRGLCPPGVANETAGLRRGDLFSLAQSLATLAGGAVSIVDTAGRIVGYSTLPDQPIDEVRRKSTLALKEAEPPSEDIDHIALFRSTRAMWVAPGPGRLGRVALPVRAQGELLGSVWLIVGEEENADAAIMFLNSVAGLTAHHMLEARDLEAAEGARSSDLLRTIMEDSTYRVHAAAELGLRTGEHYRALAFGASAPDGMNPVLASRRQLHQIWLIARSLFTWCRVAVLGDEIVVLVASASDERANAFAERVLTSNEMPHVAGIGSEAIGVENLAASMREAISIAQLLGRSVHQDTSGKRIARLDDVREQLGLERLLRHLDSTGVLEGDPLDRMDQFDASTGSDLAHTVTVFLESLGSVSECASALHVHPNTVRYRLEQVRSLGINLDLPSTRLWVWARISARSMFGS
ncbi:helix-turn-helix domain-containing protein [Leucobacter sp. CSA2]|uniref:Helix-turn-helix domain-containing protein n=1 Tax=Leucobacter edaphi TaxID=2796472 RepID=A0A934QDC6_9MICO|nr:helix-turn-helix domain-containing protein [Leucobacter edaphi]MBK0421726.1 helix-turn-helix domain-containing protein [Leucobacter edaphi]